MALFRVDDLSNGGHRFKIDVNANTWMLTGQAVICSEPGARSLVVVEGGCVRVRAYACVRACACVRWPPRCAQTTQSSLWLDVLLLLLVVPVLGLALLAVVLVGASACGVVVHIVLCTKSTCLASKLGRWWVSRAVDACSVQCAPPALGSLEDQVAAPYRCLVQNEAKRTTGVEERIRCSGPWQRGRGLCMASGTFQTRGDRLLTTRRLRST